MFHVGETDHPTRLVPAARRRGLRAARVARAVGELVVFALVLALSFAVIWVALSLWLEVTAREFPRVVLSALVGAT